jgi:hypothetical protein
LPRLTIFKVFCGVINRRLVARETPKNPAAGAGIG